MTVVGISCGALTVKVVRLRGADTTAVVEAHQGRPLGTPMLTYESDGYAVTPAFLRQVEVHIQQVLECAAQRLGARSGAAAR